MAMLRLALALVLCTAMFPADAEEALSLTGDVGVETTVREIQPDVLLDVGVGAKEALQSLEGDDKDDEESSSDSSDHAKMEYAVFKAMMGGTLEADKESHYIRHMGDGAEVTTASSENDKRDIVWKVRSPMCVPGSSGCPTALIGDPKCMSFESANWKGHYLHAGSNGRVHLKKPDGNNLSTYTFCMRPGLADKQGISFESLAKPKFFVRHNAYHLYVCDNTNEGNCGKTSLDAFRKDCTFTKSAPSFFGTCEGPSNPTKCSCARGRTGPKCMVQCPGLLDGGKVSCSGQGACFFDKAKQKASCRCHDGQIGEDCAQECPKGISQQVCSKNGKCSLDRLGQSKCECVGPWRGKTCDSRCPGASEDKVCTGNGACMYDEVKAVTFCKCEKGFLGENCKTTCPKDDKGRICSAKGECVPGGPQGGKCVCEEGSMGSDCALTCEKDPLGRICGGADRGVCEKESDKGTTVCKCKKGFMGKDCNVECPRQKNGDVCSNQGTCFMDAETNKAKCVCKKGFTGNQCEVKCNANANGDVCNGHGKCSAAEGQTKCECTGGFVGNDCQHNCPGSAKTGGKVACSGHGQCSLGDDKTPVCKCATGFLGEGCDTACPKDKGITCGGQGTCILENGQAQCKCKQGFMGSTCQYECPGRTKTSTCSGKGKCLLAGSEGKKGGGFKTNCLCEKGFGGRICEKSCPAKGGKVCFNNGECVTTPEKEMMCMCKKGWLGKDCSIPCPVSTNGQICSQRGMCTASEDGKSAKCDCKEGFEGPSCSHTCPASGGKMCSGHGKCSFKAAESAAACTCDDEFTGATCSQTCPTDESGTICNGNGKCSLKDNQAVCKCNAGHTGKDCEHRVCGTANSLFDTKTSRCLCEPGYTCCSKEAAQTAVGTSKGGDELAEFVV